MKGKGRRKGQDVIYKSCRTPPRESAKVTKSMSKICQDKQPGRAVDKAGGESLDGRVWSEATVLNSRKCDQKLSRGSFLLLLLFFLPQAFPSILVLLSSASARLGVCFEDFVHKDLVKRLNLFCHSFGEFLLNTFVHGQILPHPLSLICLVHALTVGEREPVRGYARCPRGRFCFRLVILTLQAPLVLANLLICFYLLVYFLLPLVVGGFFLGVFCAHSRQVSSSGQILELVVQMPEPTTNVTPFQTT